MGRAADPREPPSRQAARGLPPVREIDRGQTQQQGRRTNKGPPDPEKRGLPRRDRGAVSPWEATQLLEEGRDDSSGEDELASNIVAWGCWSGSVGFLMAMAVVSSVLILAQRTGHLRLDLWNQSAQAPAEPAAVLGESLRPQCAAARLPSHSPEGQRGGQHMPLVLSSDGCCRLCEAASDCESWAWAGQGDRQGCRLFTQGGGGAAEIQDDGEAAETAEEHDLAQEPQIRAVVAAIAEAQRAQADAGGAGGGQATKDLAEAAGAQEHTSEAGQGDDEADERDAEEGHGERPDDEEEAPSPVPRAQDIPAWHSPWSKISVKEEHPGEAHEGHRPPGCDAGGRLPKLWAHRGGKEAVLKVLTYNLFWWSLFGERDGDHDKAAHLIEEAAESRSFDLMGFQECEDVERVLRPAGLMDKYHVFSGSGKTEAICIAASKASFDLLSQGMQAVGEDSKEEYFGKRSAQWMRLNHKKTDQKVFFMNHHGPLPVNSGGKCGGRATAHELLQLVAAEAERGDAVVMVGDFNAGDGSSTVESLEKRLHRVYHGSTDGGIDNFFTNLNLDSVRQAENLGSGGSDHDALSVELQVGGVAGAPPPPAEGAGDGDEGEGEDPPDLAEGEGGGEASLEAEDDGPPDRAEGEGEAAPDQAEGEGGAAPEAAPEAEDDRPASCGVADEGGVVYSGLDGEEVADVASPADCCSACSMSSTCKSWTWTGNPKSVICSLWFALPKQREHKDGFISGLPARKARVDFMRS